MKARSRRFAFASLIVAVLALLPGTLFAKPVGERAALKAAKGWLAVNADALLGDTKGKPWKAANVRDLPASDGSILAYVVDLDPQGFIVVPADDSVEPIITFGLHGNFDETQYDCQVLLDIIKLDIPGRVAHPEKFPKEYKDQVKDRWAGFGQAGDEVETFGQLASGPLDMAISAVVAPFIADRWNQGSPYNYYTPDNLYTGCVATAMGMIIHYYQYPQSASCSNTIYIRGTATPATFTSTYVYSLMPTSINGSSPLNQIQEVAKLLSDCGISVSMQYDDGGSGASTYSVAGALVDTFGYASAGWKWGDDSDWQTVLQKELSWGYPAELSIRQSNPDAGHAIVCDGWGIDGGQTRYHLNMGWGGYADNWYQVPGFSAGGYTWDTLSGFVYNIRRPDAVEVRINNDGTYTNSTTVTLALTNPPDGATQVQFSNDNATYSSWEPYISTKTWTLSTGDGPKTAFLKYKDGADKVYPLARDMITLDTGLPTGTLTINSGAATTTTRTVTLSITGSDTLSGANQMCFSNDGTTWSAWQALAATKSWDLSTGDGTKTVYMKVNDAAGNESDPITDTIDLQLIPAPTSLTATPISDTQINLSWVDNASNETGYKIERKTGSGGTWSQITTVAADSTSYNNTGLTANTNYYYRVRAYNAEGDSAYSNTANTTTFVTAAPTGLTATAASDTQINLAWTDNSTNETGFRIERKNGAGGTWAEIATVGANVVTYNSTGLTASTQYYYRVRAYTASGNSAYSNEANATTYAMAAPSGLRVTSTALTQINLAWNDNSSNETGFSIERKTGSGGTWAEVGTVGADVKTFNNSGLTINTTYYYRVRAYNATSNSNYSNELIASTPALASPGSLATTAISDTRIDLSWRDNSSDETGFKIERRTGTTGTWSEIGAVGAGTTTYQSTGLTANTNYYYRVRAYNTNGNSNYSNLANTTTFVIAGPGNLTATAISDTQINLSWTDNSTTETGFRIERKTGSGGTWAEITTVGANVTTYSNTGLTGNTQYYYRVRAYTASGNSAYSNEANATTYAIAAPSVLRVTSTALTQINLAWNDNSSNETGFKIERKTGSGGTWAEVGTVGANVKTFNSTGLTINTTYYCRVRAYNATDNSNYSNEISATTPALPSPGFLTATAISDTQINLSWVDNSPDETGFKIERRTGTTGTWAQIGTVGAGVTTYQNTGLTAGTQYYYRVRAYNAVGNSNYSNLVNATTMYVAPPSALTATAVSNTQINLAWTDNSSNETGFRIERKTGASGTWAEIAAVAANVKTYNNTGLTANTQYYYRVRSYVSAGNSPYSSEANATTYEITAPSLPTATAVSETQINLSWKDNSTTETGFVIERKPAGGTWSQVITVGANVTTYQDTDLTTGTSYGYRVKAVTSTGSSGYSVEAWAWTWGTLTRPWGLKATPVSSTQINLSWIDNSTAESGFKIERKTGAAGTWAEIDIVGAGVKTYSSTGLTASTQYYYRVRAYDTSGNSAYSNEANGTTSP